MDRFSLKFRAAIAAGLLAIGLVVVGALQLFPFDVNLLQVEQPYGPVAHLADDLDQAILTRQRALASAAELLGQQMRHGTVGFDNFLQQHQALSAAFDDVFVIGVNAKIAESWPEKNGWKGGQVGDRAYFKQTLATRKPVISQPFLDKLQHQPSIVMTAPVLGQQGRVIAVLGARLNLLTPNFISDVREKKIGESGYFYLTTRDGVLLSHPNQQRIMQTLAELPANHASDGSALASVDSGSAQDWYSFKRLQTVDWVLAGVLPTTATFQPGVAPGPMLVLAGVTVLTVMLLAWLAMQRWLAPLRRLQTDIETMRDDPQLHVLVPVRRQDEIGAVTVAFNGLIQQRRQTVQGLIAEKDWVVGTLNSIADAVVTSDDSGHIEYLNQMAECLTGWSIEEARGQLLSAVLRIVDEQTQERVTSLLEQALNENRAVAVVRQGILTRRDGSEVPIDNSAAPIRDRAGQLRGAVFVLHDVTLQRKVTNRAQWEAQHDPLTGLANRRGFEEQLGETIRNASKRRAHSYLLLLDLDHFKQVNDTGGHAAGDGLLKEIAKLLQSQVRSVDLSARLGGDEFAVLLQNCPQSEAIRIAHKIRQAIWDLQFCWCDAVFHVGVSIGAAPITHETVTMRQAMQQADEACYQSKAAGRNQFALYGVGIA